MSVSDIPAPAIDPHLLPPPILTSEPNSFAQYTFRVRVPNIIQQVMELNPFPPEIRRALEELGNEIAGSVIRSLGERARDRAFWDTVSQPYLRRSWFEVPWYWAEAFFYRRVLEATRYFQPGPWYAFDPFAVMKRAELELERAPRLVDSLCRELPDDTLQRFWRLLHASLWGNRMDLSFPATVACGREVGVRHDQARLIVDESAWVWERLASQQLQRVAILVDNAGTELLMDVALADFLLAGGLARTVVLHLKMHPFFVSDATPADLHAALAALPPAGDAAQGLHDRIVAHLRAGRLTLQTHWFYTSCLFYFQLPADLRQELAGADLAILKGDLNYRRLLGDAHWPPTASFRHATSYFPTAFVTLRTLKSELITGLREGQAEVQQSMDPLWLIDGRWGAIQTGGYPQTILVR
ncbi:MAG: damage-control phosphatase ARMT1 family protein [Armatimonadota bacterium]|nr:damage-control phosphatase ARMT1 family protein [Armatimonadota bacterium]MDR7539236.1 damage-control phosphatase ARMT1 family protein [Armatimonadota bacterium]